jgi:hypothetical protein
MKPASSTGQTSETAQKRSKRAAAAQHAFRKRKNKLSEVPDQYAYSSCVMTPIACTTDDSCPAHVLKTLGAPGPYPETASWAYFAKKFPQLSMWALQIGPKPNGMAICEMNPGDPKHELGRYALLYASHTVQGEHKPHWVIGWKRAGVPKRASLNHLNKAIRSFYLRGEFADGPGCSGGSENEATLASADVSGDGPSASPVLPNTTDGSDGAAPAPTFPSEQNGLSNAPVPDDDPSEHNGPSNAPMPDDEPAHTTHPSDGEAQNIPGDPDEDLPDETDPNPNPIVEPQRWSHRPDEDDPTKVFCHKTPLMPSMGIPWRPVFHQHQSTQGDLYEQKKNAGEICLCYKYPFCRHCKHGLVVFGDATVRDCAANWLLRPVYEERPTNEVGVLTEDLAFLDCGGGKANEGAFTRHELKTRPIVAYKRGKLHRPLFRMIGRSAIVGVCMALRTMCTLQSRVAPSVQIRATARKLLLFASVAFAAAAVRHFVEALHHVHFLMFRDAYNLVTQRASQGWITNKVSFWDSAALATGALTEVRYEDHNEENELFAMYPDESSRAVIRKILITRAADPVTIRGMISMGSSKNRHETYVNPKTMVAAVERLVKMTEKYPGAARQYPPLQGVLENCVNNPCLFCTAPYTVGKFRHRLCPHHREMVYNNKVPSADTPEAMAVMTEGIPHTNGKSYGPYVTVGRDLPLPKIDTVPHKALFGKGAAKLAIRMADPSLVVEPKTAITVGYGFAKAPVFTPAKGPPIAYKAILARIGRRARNQPQQLAFNKAKMYFQHMFAGVEPVAAMPLDEWMTTIRRKVDMQKVIDTLQLHGLPVDFDAPVWKAHIKMEKSSAVEKLPGVNPPTFVPINDFKPRLIQAPPDWVHVMLGPFVKTVLHQIETFWTCESPIFYAGCAKPHQLQRWLQRVTKCTDHWFITLDYKMFDCTHSEISFEFAESIYALFVHHTEFSEEILKRIRTPKGYACGIKYKAPKDMNGSGRPDTSLVNIVNSVAALVTMCAMAITGKELEDLEIADYVLAMDVCLIAAAGDDSVVVMPRSHNGREITAEFIDCSIGKFGFDAPHDKATIAPTFEGMVFLGHMPYPVGGDWFWGPTLARRLYKHHTMLAPHGDLRAWLHGVAKMEKLCYPHVPILADMADVVLAQLKGHKVNAFNPVDAQYKAAFCGPDFTPPPYDATTVAYVEGLYGMEAGAIKDFVTHLPPLPAMLDHSVIDALMAVDEM